MHLDVGYTGGDSDGSREKPYTLYGYAVGQVAPGGRIVFAAGDHSQGIRVSKSISLVGRCSSMVTISGVKWGAYGWAALEVSGDVSVAISGLTISAPGIGLSVHTGSEVSPSRAWLKDNYSAGILAAGSGTAVTASEVWVSGTQLNSEGTLGVGVLVQEGVIASVSRSLVSKNHSSGIRAISPETTVTVSDVWVSGTKMDAAGQQGYGMDVQGGASLSVSRSRISDAHTAGIQAFSPETTVTVSEVWVSGTRMDDDGNGGVGLVAVDGVSLSVSRSRVSDYHYAGIEAQGSGSTATLSEVWVSGAETTNEGHAARGLAARSGAHLNVNRCRVSEAHPTGVLASSSGSTVTASELWVSETRMDSEGLKGAGVLVQSGASLSLSRSWLSENHSSGVALYGSETTGTVSEGWMSGTQMDGTGWAGSGVQVVAGASLSMSSSRVSDCDEAAVTVVSAGASVTESLLEGAKPGGYQLGDGLLVTGSVVTAHRIIARDNARVGVLFHNSDGELTGSLITQNAVGLANQGLPGATISDDNRIEGNDVDHAGDGDLEVPHEVMELPECSGGGD